MLGRVRIPEIDVRVGTWTGRGWRSCQNLLTHHRRGGGPVTQATWRGEMDSRTLAPSRRKLGPSTGIRGYKTNEPSEGVLVAWHN